MKIESRNPADLKPHPRNAKTHSADQITALGRAIAEFGFHQPIVIDEDDTVLIGHARREAAIAAGIGEVPTIRKAGLEDADKRALILADNRLREDGSSWDDEVLEEELRFLLGEKFDLTLTGFDLGEFADAGEGTQAVVEPRVSEGDMWAMGRHRLACLDPGACFDGFEPAKMALVRYPSDDRPTLAWPSDVIYLLSDPPHDMGGPDELLRSGFEPRAQIICQRHPRKAKGPYRQAADVLWYAVRKGRKTHWNGNRKQTTLWETERTAKAGDLPVDLWQTAIRNHTSAGDVVLIGWPGPGGALLAAHSTGRVGWAAEPDPAVCDALLRRWETLTGEIAEKVEESG